MDGRKVTAFSLSQFIHGRWYEPEEAQYILVGLALVASMPIAGPSPPGHKIPMGISG